MIDTTDMTNRLISAARLAVGPLLHQVKMSDGSGGFINVGACYKSKDSRPKGQYPMIIVDIATRQLQNNYATAKYYNSEGSLVTEIVYDYFITYAVYGGDAMMIASELESSFVREDINYIFTHDCFGQIAETFAITENITRINNETKDFASFIVKLTTVDKVVESMDAIQCVDLDLHLRHVDSEDDIVSAEIVIKAP